MKKNNTINSPFLDKERMVKHQAFQRMMYSKVNTPLLELQQKALKHEGVQVNITEHLIQRLNDRGIHMKSVLTVIQNGKMIEYQGSHFDDKQRVEINKKNKALGIRPTEAFDVNCFNVLLLGWVDDTPLHVAINIRNGSDVSVKTVYDPSKEDVEKWVEGSDYRARMFYKK